MKTFATLFLLAGFAISASAQYCMLPNRNAYSQYQPGIIKFTLNDIERISGNVENGLNAPPIVVTSDTTELVRGQTYTIMIDHTEDPVYFPGARNNIRIWVDYNQNFSFAEAGETALSQDFKSAGTFTGTITIPASAPLGYTRLRATAKMSSDVGHTIPTPCDVPADPLGYHGEIEDYTLHIVEATSIDAVANQNLVESVYPNPATNNLTVTLKDKRQSLDRIQIFSITGTLMFSQTPVTSRPGVYEVNLQEYALVPGSYVLRLCTKNETSFYRFLKVD